jgi:5-oxoprolinase (ATP-hydrolysing) subunit A
MRVDLNADAGESFGAWTMGDDVALVREITSVNVACGFHAGDPTVMRRTIRLAAQAGVAVGAHPGFPDLQGFGRRSIHLSPSEVEDLILYQVAALSGVARAEAVPLTHVKPHGALYSQAAGDRALADAIARAVRAVDSSLALVGLAGSVLIDAARNAGLRPISEAFVDRAYLPDGTLCPRGAAGAVIADPAEAALRAVRLVREGHVAALDGTDLPIRADTMCIHGDTPGAVTIARAVRVSLERAGVSVRSFATS